MSNHRFDWNEFAYSFRKQYTAFAKSLESLTPQNRICINPRGGRMQILRSAPGGAYVNARNKRERAGGHARDWVRGSL